MKKNKKLHFITDIRTLPFAPIPQVIFVLLCLCSLLLLQLFTCVTTFSAAADYKELDRCEIYVAGITGGLQLFDEDTNKWMPLEEGECLIIGSKIKTNIGQFAVLKHKDGNSIWVNELTVLIVEESENAQSINQINLKKGKTILNLQTVGEEGFTVQTPTAVAGVRGTEFSVDVDEAEDTEIEIAEGEVEIANDVEGKTLPAGNIAKIVRGKAIGKFSPEKIEAMKERFGKVKNKAKAKAILKKKMRKNLWEKQKNKKLLKAKMLKETPDWKKKALLKRWQEKKKEEKKDELLQEKFKEKAKEKMKEKYRK